MAPGCADTGGNSAPWASEQPISTTKATSFLTRARWTFRLSAILFPAPRVGGDGTDIFEVGTAVGENGHPFRAVLETDGSSSFSTQEAAFAVGGHNGWHSHPGIVAVTVLSGTILFTPALFRADSRAVARHGCWSPRMLCGWRARNLYQSATTNHSTRSFHSIIGAILRIEFQQFKSGKTDT